MNSVTIELKKLWLIAALILSIVVLALYIQVTLNYPIVFGDEGYHTRMAQWIAQHVEYPIWIPFEKSLADLTGNTRPPMFSFVEAGFLAVFNDVTVLNILTPLTAILIGLSTFVLLSKLYNQRMGFFAAAIVIMLPSFVTYAVILYTDIMLAFFFSVFAFTFIIGLLNDSKKYLLLSGVFAAFTFLTKSVGYSAIFLVLLAFLYELYKKKDLKIITKYLYVAIPFILIILPYFARNIIYYGTPDCYLPFFDRSGCNKILNVVEEKYSFEARTQATGTEVDVFSMGIIDYLNFAYGNAYFIVPVFLAGIGLLVTDRGRRNVLLAISLLSMILLFIEPILGRAEDTARYTLAWAPIIAAVCALYLDRLCDFAKKYQNYLAVALVVIIFYFGYPQLISKLTTMSSVKQFSSQFFIACDWIKDNLPEDALISTIWTYRTTYSAQRDVMGMPADIRLSRDVNYTLSVTKAYGITHLFIQKFSLYTDSTLRESYGVDFVQFLENNPTHFKKVYENGPTLQTCINQGGCDGDIIYEVVY